MSGKCAGVEFITHYLLLTTVVPWSFCDNANQNKPTLTVKSHNYLLVCCCYYYYYINNVS